MQLYIQVRTNERKNNWVIASKNIVLLFPTLHFVTWESNSSLDDTSHSPAEKV